jgi:hypothetical protein
MNTITLEEEELTSDDIREDLAAANRLSLKSESLAETMDKFID